MVHFHVIAGPDSAPARPSIRHIKFADLKEALTKGIDDFWAMPSQVVFLGLIYPIVGVCLVPLTSGQNALPLLYPLVSGFALIGPFAAIGLYEMSRRRELGLDTSWRHAFEVVRSPSIPSILAVGLLLLGIFLLWLATAKGLYVWFFGPLAPDSYFDFLKEVLTTSAGWSLILLGNAIGFVFTVVVFSISVVSFPLLLDRDVGAVSAIVTSIKAVATNPLVMGLWGVIVSTLLIIGSLPLLIGLAVIMPILGHATWHLYRRVVEQPAGRDINAVSSGN
ncbi:hypothetical protein CU048_13930 [Beijerinckiaceae bacterium]|nr:hypothetical protein CU048_13930 [Beijerinckiaceae bacterium]